MWTVTSKICQNADTFAFLQILPSTDPTKVFHTKNWLDLSLFSSVLQDHEGYSKVRTNSAIHIKVYKKQLSQVATEGISKEVTWNNDLSNNVMCFCFVCHKETVLKGQCVFEFQRWFEEIIILTQKSQICIIIITLPTSREQMVN